MSIKTTPNASTNKHTRHNSSEQHVTGVTVSPCNYETSIKRQPDELILNEKQLEYAREAFSYFDNDDSGFISFDELKLAFDKMGRKVSDSKLKKMLATVDTDGSGEIGFTEFLDLIRD